MFNWLYARHTGGTFVLRIEDTDQARNSQEAVDVILSGLRWLGLDWDEGPLSGKADGPSQGEVGPYFQSQRQSNYLARIAELRERGSAYERDGAIYFRMDRSPILVSDVIVGDVTRALTDRESDDPDFVIVRSDGAPVFHLVNVIDDLEMGITHVIRGEDHLSNTPKHIALFRAFGVEPPRYAHIPLILNQDGSKMSKRDQGASLQTYIDNGYTPEAVVNYLALLGWTPKDLGDVFSKAEAAKQFDLPQVHRSNARFDMKKLDHFHFEQTRRMAPDHFVLLGIEALKKAGILVSGFDEDYVRRALSTAQEKGKLFNELPIWVDFFFVKNDEVKFDLEAKAKVLTSEGCVLLAKLRDRFKAVVNFVAQELEVALKAVAAENNLKVGAFVQPCRVACTGKLIGPSLYHLLEVLGRERVTRRIANVLAENTRS